MEHREVWATTSRSLPQSLWFQDNTQKLAPKGLSMEDSCHTKGTPREVSKEARQRYPAFSAESSANTALSQPGPVPNAGPGSRGPTSWPADLHAWFAEEPWTCLPTLSWAECAEFLRSQRMTAAPGAPQAQLSSLLYFLCHCTGHVAPF